MNTARDVLTELERVSSPTQAVQAMRFFKTGKGQYGEGDVFIGIKSPDIKKLAQKYARDLDLKETEELLRIVPLRRLAARLGVEKVFLKGGRMSLFFVSNPDSPYYQSQAFGKVIAYMMKYTRRCDLREQNNKRSMLVKDVKTVEEAVCVLQEVVAMQVEE